MPDLFNHLYDQYSQVVCSIHETDGGIEVRSHENIRSMLPETWDGKPVSFTLEPTPEKIRWGD